LRDKFALDLSPIDCLETDVIEVCEVWEVRNILIHKAVVVDRRFKQNVKNGKYRLGEKVSIDKDLMDKTINTFHNVVTLIDREVKAKYF
jgi:hypothetical protein